MYSIYPPKHTIKSQTRDLSETRNPHPELQIKTPQPMQTTFTLLVTPACPHAHFPNTPISTIPDTKLAPAARVLQSDALRSSP